MRLALIIVSLAATAVGLVHLRRAETSAAHEIQAQRAAQVELRRRLWDQQVELGWLTAPHEVRRRADEMSLRLSAPRGPAADVAGR